MSEQNKILFVGLGLLISAILLTTLFFFWGEETPREEVSEVTNGTEATIPVDDAVYTKRGSIVSVRDDGAGLLILSEDGEYFFTISEANIIGVDGASKNVDNLMPGMSIEAVLQRGRASSLRVISVPQIMIISPAFHSVINLNFEIKGVAPNKEGDICFSLNNRRTGAAYKENLSVPIEPNGQFIIPVNLSAILDAMPGDMLDARFAICGEEVVASIAWQYYTGLTSRIKVYFLKNSCGNFDYVWRVIPAYLPTMRTSIEELLKGPSEQEAEMGMFSAVNPGEQIQSVSIERGISYLDFAPSFLRVARCSVPVLREQLTRTINQFPNARAVITIDGDRRSPFNTIGGDRDNPVN